MSDDYTAEQQQADDLREDHREHEPVRRRAGERRATVFMWGLAFDCTYDYEPAEPAVLWGPNPCPGYPEQVNLTAAFSGETDMLDMMEMLTETDNVDVIEQLLMEALEC